MYLYIITFPNNKQYVGITTNMNKRKTVHKSRAKNGRKELVYNAIRKYGWDKLNWTIADGYDDWKELCNLEKIEIAKYNTFCGNINSNGYNMTIGGDGHNGLKHTEEWKKNDV